jgi:hypothetical protein
MKSQKIEEEIREIEEIANKILKESSSQTCGTEYQKWTYAMIKAKRIYNKTK